MTEPAQDKQRKRHGLLALSLVGLVAAMVGASFAAVPLYRLFCQATGYGGVPQRAERAPGEVLDRTIRVRFDGNVDGALPWTGEPLLMLQPPRLNVAATYTQTAQRRGPRHEGFVEIAKQGNIDLLMHGDSITDWWVQGDANKAMFDKYFGGIRTANFAIAGDTTQGVLWGLKNGEGQGFQPKAAMLMIGTNNTISNTGPEIAEGIGAVVLELRQDFPQAKILLLAVFPRSVPGDPVRDKIAEINRIIARLGDEQHVFYMDIGAKFLGADGYFLPDAFRPDNLHPQAKGYEIWGEAVKDKLVTLLK